MKAFKALFLVIYCCSTMFDEASKCSFTYIFHILYFAHLTKVRDKCAKKCAWEHWEFYVFLGAPKNCKCSIIWTSKFESWRCMGWEFYCIRKIFINNNKREVEQIRSRVLCRKSVEESNMSRLIFTGGKSFPFSHSIKHLVW